MEKILLHLDVQGHVIGYTVMPIAAGQANTFLVENPEQDLVDNYLHYKVVDEALVHLSDEEYESLYPILEVKQTQEERIETMENAMQELILMQMGGAE